MSTVGRFRSKYITATATNLAVEINQAIIESARKGKAAEIKLPTIVNRAFMLVHETGIIPVVDYRTSTNR